jgi:hypothetical protein
LLKIAFFLRSSKASWQAKTQTFTAPAFGFGNQGELKMPYVYADVRKLEKHAKVGTVNASRWFERTRARACGLFLVKRRSSDGRTNPCKRTAIATFVNDRWPANPHGNHAAFYLGKVSTGMYIMDQWNRADKKEISSRFIYRLGKNKDGSYVRPSDNADAFSVIE